MKKIITILLMILLVGCATAKKDIKDLSIVVPSGAPSLAFYNETRNDNFNTSDAASILPELKSDSGSDIIVIDTVNGIKALNAGANYKLAATITFGNFYIASTGLDSDGVMNDGDYIVLFSQNATPDLLFHSIYENGLDSNIHYVSAVSDAATCLIKGINISDENRQADEEPYVDYVMIAEPALSMALGKNDNASVYANIQDLYEELSRSSDEYPIMQASLFVSNRLDNEQVDEYLAKLENSINDLLKNPELFKGTLGNIPNEEVKEIFGVPNMNITTKVLTENSINLGFKKAYDYKEAIDRYIAIYGMENTSEEIYYK